MEKNRHELEKGMIQSNLGNFMGISTKISHQNIKKIKGKKKNSLFLNNTLHKHRISKYIKLIDKDEAIRKKRFNKLKTSFITNFSNFKITDEKINQSLKIDKNFKEKQKILQENELHDIFKNKELEQEKIDPGPTFLYLAYNQHH